MCNTGVACVKKARELNFQSPNCTPTLVFVEVVFNEGDNGSSPISKRSSQRLSSSTAQILDYDRPARTDGSSISEDFYGFSLLKHVVSEIQHSDLSKLTVSIAIIREEISARSASNHSAYEQNGLLSAEISSQKQQDLGSVRTLKCLEAGATDVILEPFTSERVKDLTVHAYHAHVNMAKEKSAFLEEKRMRKRSWVGVDEEIPYAYLRESM